MHGIIENISNDGQLEKAFSPIEIIEEGIVILINDEHPEKAFFPILVTEEGIVIFFNDEHPKKVLSLSEHKEERIENVTCVNDSQ